MQREKEISAFLMGCSLTKSWGMKETRPLRPFGEELGTLRGRDGQVLDNAAANILGGTGQCDETAPLPPPMSTITAHSKSRRRCSCEEYPPFDMQRMAAPKRRARSGVALSSR